MHCPCFRESLGVYLGGPKERKKILREILKVERDALQLSSIPPEVQRARSASQLSHAEKLSQPRQHPQSIFSVFTRAPSALRGRGHRSPDVLFDPADGDLKFWLYGSQRVSQSTLGSLVNQFNVSLGELTKSSIWAATRRKVDLLLTQAASLQRCGFIFDIISTSKIISSGLPHGVGRLIYHHVDTVHYDKTALKFAFVGITDNVNCCAARDVFCRDDTLNGKYVGDSKRTFDALDNVHMFAVFPGEQGNRHLNRSLNVKPAVPRQGELLQKVKRIAAQISQSHVHSDDEEAPPSPESFHRKLTEETFLTDFK